MKAWTPILVSTVATLGAAWASADFDGPAPVAWRWAQSTSASPSGSPLVSGDTVYAAVGGRIYALERQTGNQVWRFPVAEPLEANFTKGAAMGDGVVVAAAEKMVYAVDAGTGKLKWQYLSPGLLTGAPIVVGKHVVLGVMPGSLISLDLSSGQPDWSQPLDLKGNLMPNMAAWQDNVIVLTNTPAVASVSLAAQKVNWSVSAGSLSNTSVPVVFGDTVYVNTGYYLTALGASRGSKKWDRRMDANLAFGPAVSDSGVAVVSNEGIVWTLDLRGNFVFKKGIDLGTGPSAPPSFVGRMVAVGTDNGSLNIIDPRSGEVVFNYVVPPLFRGAKATGGSGPTTTTGSDQEIKYVQVAGPSVAAGDTLLVLTRDGSLVAFDKKLGVDLTAPTVKMAWPYAGEQVSGQPPLQLVFLLEDAASGVNPDSVKVTINGTEYGGTYTRDGYLSVRISAVGANRPLMDGRAEINVLANDWMGNKADVKFSLTIDNTLPAIGGPPVKDGAKTGGGGVPGGGRKGGGG